MVYKKSRNENLTSRDTCHNRVRHIGNNQFPGVQLFTVQVVNKAKDKLVDYM